MLTLALIISVASLAISPNQFELGRVSWIVLTNLVTFVSIIGLWKMKKWAVYLYLGGYAVGIATFYLFSPENAELLNKPYLELAVPLLYSIVVLPYWRRLN